MFGVSTSASTESPGPPQVVTLNKDQVQKKIQVCKFFVKDKTCPFGKKCRFLHPEESYPVYVQRSFAVENEAVSEESVSHRTSKPKVYLPPHRLRPRAQHEAVNKRATEEEPLPINQNTFGQICKFYSRNGFCKFGDSCKYIHDQDQESDDCGETDVREQTNYGGRRGRGGRGRGFSREKRWSRTGGDPVDTHGIKPLKSLKQKPKSRQLCRYFMNGDCRHGDECKFWHPSELPEVSDGDSSEVGELTNQLEFLTSLVKADESRKFQPSKQKVVTQPIAEFSIETLTDEDAAKHRIAEVNTLMKRFPRAEPTVLPRRKEDVYKIAFTPSDPDWVSLL